MATKTYGTFHYVVSNIGKIVLSVYGEALRERAFESASRHREQGVGCEVLTRTDYRTPCGEKI